MPDQQSEVNLLEVMAQIFKSAGQYLSLVCDWADLPAEAVQDYAYEMLATPAEQHSRSVRQVVWRAPEKAGGHSLANAD